MSPTNETKTRCVEFMDDVLSDAMSNATDWLKEKDEKGVPNSFYALSIHSEYDGELGWTIVIVCGL